MLPDEQRDLRIAALAAAVLACAALRFAGLGDHGPLELVPVAFVDRGLHDEVEAVRLQPEWAAAFARFGEMLRKGGEFNGQRILDAAVIEDLRRGGDREKFKASGMAFRPGYSYHNQWWILHNADGAFEASGVNGQMLHINPAAEMVVVKLSSHPIASAGPTHPLTLRAWAALASAVRQ